MTVATFIDKACEGTLIEVVQTYSVAGAAQAEQTIKGAPEGWRQILDKLEAEVERMRQAQGAVRSVVHGALHLDRTYDAAPDAVHKALSEEAAKPLVRRNLRAGGSSSARWTSGSAAANGSGGFESGVTTMFDAVYHDIVPRERIVYAYEMRLDDRKLFVSPATLQIKPAGESRTKLLVDEQGAFLDGYDDAGSRERGTADLLDKLGASLRS